MSRIDVILHNKEGNAQIGLNPATVATQVEINAEDGSASNVEAEIIALRTHVANLLQGGASFKGTLTSSTPLPTVGYKAGWQYVVQEAGTYAGQQAEVGEMFIALRDYASGSASDKDWTLLQVNIVGAVTGPANSVAQHVAVFEGTSGKIIKDSGFTIQKSVPADAEFTDTTYSAASETVDGLMTKALFTTLSNIEANADVTDAVNVAAAGAVMKTDSSDELKQGSVNLYMLAAEREKLAGIEAGADKSIPCFNEVFIGYDDSFNASESRSLRITGGTGIQVQRGTGTGVNHTIEISEQYIDSCMVTSLTNVPTNLRDGGLIILKK